MVVVPDVTGLDPKEASIDLFNLLLTASVHQEPNDQVASGLVFSIDPPAGTSVAQGTEIALTVSTGPATPAPTSPQA